MLNLYERRGYFWWRNPVDGKTHGLGRDKAMAVQEAIDDLAGGKDAAHLP